MTMSLAKSLSELPEYRYVLGNLIARDLKVKYQTKVLGFLWSLLYPGMMIAIWYVVFRGVMRIEMPQYWAFLIVGMLPYQFISNGIIEGSSAVRRSAGIIRKVYVPLEILVIAGVTVKLVEFLLQMAVAIAFLLIAHDGDDLGISLVKAMWVLPTAILLMYIFVLGVALPLSAWTVLYRDLEHIVSIGLTCLMYLTPVFWSLTLVDDRPWKWVFVFNPVMNFIELFRGPLYWGQWPSNGAVGGGAAVAWLLALAFAAVTFIIGYTLFDRTKRVLAEVV